MTYRMAGYKVGAEAGGRPKPGDLYVATLTLAERPKTKFLLAQHTGSEESEVGQQSLVGEITALVSAYNTKYRIGWSEWHTMEAGAFADADADENPVPFFWAHSWAWSEQTPIGVSYMSEEDDGLHARTEVWLDNPSGLAVWRANAAGALREWSIGYRVLEMRTDEDDEAHYYVTKAELLENSSVLRGANPGTRTEEVAGQKPTTTQVLVPGIERLLARGHVRDLFRPRADRADSNDNPMKEEDPA